MDRKQVDQKPFSRTFIWEFFLLLDLSLQLFICVLNPVDGLDRAPNECRILEISEYVRMVQIIFEEFWVAFLPLLFHRFATLHRLLFILAGEDLLKVCCDFQTTLNPYPFTDIAHKVHRAALDVRFRKLVQKRGIQFLQTIYDP